MGLQEMTADISKLVNLERLTIEDSPAVKLIPEEISCLQSLEDLHLNFISVKQLPAGFTELANLEALHITWCEGIRFPPDLNVSPLSIPTHAVPCTACYLNTHLSKVYDAEKCVQQK